MSIEAIAALLGHKTLAMTTVNARIVGKTVADERFAVTEKVEALYDRPRRTHDVRRRREIPHARLEIDQTDLCAWQLLSRGAALLALTDADGAP